MLHAALRIGWPSRNEEIEEVNLIGHSWFLKRKWIGSYWRDLLPSQGFDFMGYDIYMSFAIQKYLNLQRFVPSHPISDKALWEA